MWKPAWKASKPPIAVWPKKTIPTPAAAQQPDKVNKFIPINEAYLYLLREKKKRSGGEGSSPLNRQPQVAKPKISALNYRREHDLYLNYTDLKIGQKISFSIETNDVCPCCFGQGKTLLNRGNADRRESPFEKSRRLLSRTSNMGGPSG